MALDDAVDRPFRPALRRAIVFGAMRYFAVCGDLPLPRPRLRGPALRARRRPRRRVAADRDRRARLRARGAGRGGASAARGDDARLLLGWGACLALMNCCFYLGDRPAAAGDGRGDRVPAGRRASPRSARAAPRNLGALLLAVGGVYALTGVHLAGGALGLAFAFANAGLFASYIILADRVAKRPALDGIDGLGAGDARRRRRRHAAGGLGGGAGARPTRSRCSRARASAISLVGHPLRLRPARAARACRARPTA